MKPSEFRRIRRGVLDMTQEELAREIGVTSRTITSIENGNQEVNQKYALAIRHLASVCQ